MKMRLLLFVFCILVFYSCTHKVILRKSYVFKEGSIRQLSLNFINDTVCVIKNIYGGGGKEPKKIDFRCRYSVQSANYLLLTNSGDFIDTAGVGFFYFPLTYADSFMIKQGGNTVPVIPNYSKENYKYLKVPYVENDTLFRYKRNIAWIKKDRNNKVVGYYKFKPD